MNEQRITESPSWSDPRGQVMKTPDDLAEMLRLKACGWGLKRIARQLGCSHHTVKVYLRTGTTIQPMCPHCDKSPPSILPKQTVHVSHCMF
ncbi:helix-turn-helix domain-containing protein [Mesorhizobium sp. WSM3882]|uniref:helix-turn-helix domain-containing protein n=1 Tax=Mesorhizobium sp. WSM3882 TaxID=2029407 RepID=UPI000BB01893|nr:helix-turn-helix domain-containing protein [Mesorhizobium sp. WSM3882]PBB28960.1 hypothetical protein CK214_28310 [Mesorhizobium sp. WSM3882]